MWLQRLGLVCGCGCVGVWVWVCGHVGVGVGVCVFAFRASCVFYAGWFCCPWSGHWSEASWGWRAQRETCPHCCASHAIADHNATSVKVWLNRIELNWINFTPTWERVAQKAICLCKPITSEAYEWLCTHYCCVCKFDNIIAVILLPLL